MEKKEKTVVSNKSKIKKGKVKKNYDLVLEIFKPNKDGISEWITREQLKNTKLALSDNGNTRYGICFGVKQYEWEIKRKNNYKSSKIEKIRTIGYNKDIHLSRPIRNDIRKYFKNMPCIVCGNKDSIIDHKNDLYNDKRVLNVKTQEIDDFQALCNSCNLRKREICKKSKEIGKRYKATLIPMLSIFGIDFIEGDENLDISNPNAMVGTYWYDPKKFMEYIKCKLYNKNNVLSIKI